jgi:hypothetical protein
LGKTEAKIEATASEEMGLIILLWEKKKNTDLGGMPGQAVWLHFLQGLAHKGHRP